MSVLKIDTTYKALKKYLQDDIEYEIYRSATIKPYFHTSKAVDKLYFKDIFREAGLHSLLTIDEVERWLKYRDNRNNTSHDYGVDLANETLVLIEQFVVDATNLVKVIEKSDS